VAPGVDPASTVRGGGAISGSLASLRVRYYKRDEVCITTPLLQNNGRKNGLISRMLFYELYKIMVNEVTFVGFRGIDCPNPPLGSAPQ